ncbi:RES domain-containing protein [Niastella caeni]|uniref:RES domain-containing protein n=1 Tax=Niastella caeni TaxID=2569763 RepID=A0A4S8H8Y7_9BACT|nr:RES family NAD+ phosphorylase [Niastella caeni]THU31153.1 RES domain-containing protein [Niastella caeni]
MRLYRIGKTKHAHDLTGMGAKLNGGRWNHEGTPCIYLAESRALSLLEYVSHSTIETLPPALSFTTIDVPEHSMRQLTIDELPADWFQRPHNNKSRDMGSELLLNQECLLLKVPSVMINQEFNFVLNTLHPLISAVKIIDVVSCKL